MPQAVHWADKYANRNFCAIPSPGTPQGLSLGNITAFERIRALQNLTSAHRELVVVLHIPEQPAATKESYLDALLAETSLACRHLAHKPFLQQMHVNGNAALFDTQRLQALFSTLRQYLQPADNNFSWFSISLQPSRANWAALGMLRVSGFNRITLDGNEECFDAAKSLYEAARALQYNTVTMALHADPVNPALAARRLDSILQLQPDRVQLKPCHGSSLKVPVSPALAARIRQAGYAQASESCFVLPDDDLVENVCNDTPLPPPPVLGLGAGACSMLERLYYCNDDNSDSYIQALTANQFPSATGCRLPDLTT